MIKRVKKIIKENKEKDVEVFVTKKDCEYIKMIDLLNIFNIDSYELSKHYMPKEIKIIEDSGKQYECLPFNKLYKLYIRHGMIDELFYLKNNDKQESAKDTIDRLEASIKLVEYNLGRIDSNKNEKEFWHSAYIDYLHKIESAKFKFSDLEKAMYLINQRQTFHKCMEIFLRNLKNTTSFKKTKMFNKDLEIQKKYLEKAFYINKLTQEENEKLRDTIKDCMR